MVQRGAHDLPGDGIEPRSQRRSAAAWAIAPKISCGEASEVIVEEAWQRTRLLKRLGGG